MPYLLVAIGGALGSMGRYGCTVMVGRLVPGLFPYGTLTVNISGSFIIGVFAALALPGGRIALPNNGVLFLMTGICGGYTTFSSFSLDTLRLLNEGDLRRAFANVIFSVGLCLIAVWAGFSATSSLNKIDRQAAGIALEERM